MKIYALRLTRIDGSRYYYNCAYSRHELDALECFKAEQKRDERVVGFEIVDVEHIDVVHDIDFVKWLIENGLNGNINTSTV